MNNDSLAVAGDEAVVEYLLQMFPGTMDRDVIAAVVESCAGDLDHSTDVLLAMACGNKSLFTSCDSIPSNSIQQEQKTLSYAAASKKVSVANKSNESSTSSPENVKPSQDREQLKNIIYYYNKGYKILILMRGLPGCGKSYLAKLIIDKTVGPDSSEYYKHVLSTDDYFMNNTGYCYNSASIPKAHKFNQDRVSHAINDGLSPIIVDNTNVETWEMEVYVRKAASEGYIMEIVEPQTVWAQNTYELAKRNTHGVPFHKIKAMAKKYESHVTISSIMNQYKITYPDNKKPPQVRLLPAFKDNYTHECALPSNVSSTVSEQAVAINVKKPQIPQKEQTPTTSASKHTTPKKPVVNDNLESCIDDCTSHVQVPLDNTSSNDNLAESCNKQDDLNNANSRSEKQHSFNTIIPLETPNKRVNDYTLCRNSSIQELISNFHTFESWEYEAEWKSKRLCNQFDVMAPKPKRVLRKKECKVQEKILPNEVNGWNEWNSVTKFVPPWNIEQPTTSKDIPTTIIVAEEKETSVDLNDFKNGNDSKNLIGVARDINIEYNFREKTEIKIPRKLMLDKSSSTHQRISLPMRATTKDIHYKESIFLNEDILDLCDGCVVCKNDIEWSMNFFIDNNDNDVEVHLDYNSEFLNETNKSPCICALNYFRCMHTLLTKASKIKNNTDTTSPSQQQRKPRRLKTSAAGLKLKEEVEKNVVIGKHSKHTQPFMTNYIQHNGSANTKTSNEVQCKTNPEKFRGNVKHRYYSDTSSGISTNYKRFEDIGKQKTEHVEIQRTEDIDIQGPEENDTQRTKDIDIQGTEGVDIKGPKDIDIQRTKDIDIQGTKDIDIHGPEGVDIKGPKDIDIQRTKDIDIQGTEDIDIHGPEGVDIKGPKDIDIQRTKDIDIQGTEDIDIHGPEENDEKRTKYIDIQGTEDVDIQITKNKETPREESFDTTSEASVSEDDTVGEDNYYIDLGHVFVNVLDKQFGRSDIIYPNGIVTKISIPKELFETLNALWIESVIDQLSLMEKPPDVSYKDDEELARALTEIEQEENEAAERAALDPNLLSDMEYAQHLQNEEESADVRDNTPTMASVLTKRKLFHLFPDYNQDELLEIFTAHNNDFFLTVEVILTTLNMGDIVKEKNGVQNFIHKAELERRSNAAASRNRNINWALIIPQRRGIRDVRTSDLTSFNRYKHKAENENGNKKKPLPDLNVYFSSAGLMHKSLYNQSIVMAMSSYVDHMEQTRNTVDLHYLYVPESLTLLDFFLDEHIETLRAAPRNHNVTISVFVITGRGRHSVRGTPRIKPAVLDRLAERDLRTGELNPGLLTVELYSTSLLSREVNALRRQAVLSGGNLLDMISEFRKTL